MRPKNDNERQRESTEFFGSSDSAEANFAERKYFNGESL